MDEEKTIQNTLEMLAQLMVLDQSVKIVVNYIKDLNMEQLQIVFLRLEESKNKLKDLKKSYKDALNSDEGYKEIIERLKYLKERKKQIEKHIREVMSSEVSKMEDLKIDIQSDMEMLSDIAITQMMKGETVKVEDEYEQEFEPRIKVNFKKIK